MRPVSTTHTNPTETTMSKLMRITNERGMIVAYAGRVVEESGMRFWTAGSASGPMSDDWKAVPVAAGDTFEHWHFGAVEVVRVNAKSLTLRGSNGLTFRFEV